MAKNSGLLFPIGWLDPFFPRRLKFDRDFDRKFPPIRRKNNCNSESIKTGLHLVKLNGNKAFRRNIQGRKMVSSMLKNKYYFIFFMSCWNVDN